jgi:hypothetical protein
LQQTSQTSQIDLAKLRVEKFKTDSNTKRVIQSNVESLQRNLENALPAIMTELRASPENLASTFKLYRNLDALYDVLRSVTESAGAFGSKDDFQSLSNDITNLEPPGRACLGQGERAWAAAHAGARPAGGGQFCTAKENRCRRQRAGKETGQKEGARQAKIHNRHSSQQTAIACRTGSPGLRRRACTHPSAPDFLSDCKDLHRAGYSLRPTGRNVPSSYAGIAGELNSHAPSFPVVPYRSGGGRCS